MSFTKTIKDEISKIKTNKMESSAMLSALFFNLGQMDKTIKITTENASVARLIFKLVKDLYQVNIKITVKEKYNFKKGHNYILELENEFSYILIDLGLQEKDKLLLIPKEFIIDDNESEKAYLRGLFISIGSINDPKKSRYHLEFVTVEKEYAFFIKQLLNKYRLNSKILIRDNKYMVYIKEAEKISDFLRIIGAHHAVLYFEDIRIYRDHKNMINRLNNCEQANVDKIVSTATKQINDIKIIEEHGGLDLLEDKVKIIAQYRLKYPDVSLQELSNIISLETGNSITKSGLYHRFKKITHLADKIKEKK